MNKTIGYSLVCFYEATAGGHGSSEVSSSLYECLPEEKIIIEIKKKKIFSILEYYKFNYFENIYKLFYILFIFYKLKNFIKKFKENIIIIEGASWIGYSYLFLKLTKFYHSKSVVIYHSHNVEYELRRQKNNLIIAFITRILENKVYKISDFSTAVSINDQKRIKKLYNIDSIIFPNGISKQRLLAKKPKFDIPKKFIIFSGSYSYFYNKLAINKIIYNIMPKILKKDKEIKLIVTGRDFPKNKFKNYSFIQNYINLNKAELNYLIKKSLFMFTPMSKSPGTKMKIIETLLLGANLITSNKGFKGIKYLKTNNLFIYSNIRQMYKQIHYLLKNFKKKNKTKLKYSYSKYYLMENIIKDFFLKIKLKKSSTNK
jgi:hypothetical protein